MHFSALSLRVSFPQSASCGAASLCASWSDCSYLTNSAETADNIQPSPSAEEAKLLFNSSSFIPQIREIHDRNVIGIYFACEGMR